MEYEATLDLAPYTSEPKGSQQMYDLYALIVHHGRSVSSGHYIAYVKAPNGLWWLCDDTNIKTVRALPALHLEASALHALRLVCVASQFHCCNRAHTVCATQDYLKYVHR